MKEGKRKGLVGVVATLALTCALAFCLAGCSGGDKPSSAEGGSSLTIGSTAYFEEESLDPALTWWSATSYGFCETPMKLSDDSEPEPWLAESVANVDDYTWTITMKEGITFSNGEPVTGEAVKACLERTFELNQRARENLDVESIEADGQVVTIKTREAAPDFESLVTNPMLFNIYYVGEGVDYVKAPIGTGPFVVKELIPGGTLTLVKNENYWDGDVALDQVTFKKFDDDDAMNLALMNGEIDAIEGPSAAGYAQFNGKDGFQTIYRETSRVDFLRLNMETSEVMKNPAVRTAVAFCVDREGYSNVITGGMQEANWGVYSEAVAYGGTEGFNLTVDEFSVEKAAQVLEDAGIVDTDGDGIRELDGKPLTVTITTCSDYPQFVYLCDDLQSKMAQAGMKLNVQLLDYWLLDKETWMNSGTDISIDSYLMAPTGDPQYFVGLCFVSNSSDNFGGYSNPQVDALFNDLKNEFDLDARGDIARQISQIELDDCAFIFFSAAKTTIIARDGVNGLVTSPSEFYVVTPTTSVA